jgi:hypothetical protein
MRRTLRRLAQGWVAQHEANAAQWPSTLATYVCPIFGGVPVHAGDVSLIMKVLEQEVRGAPNHQEIPLWTAKPETASRVRGRIETILDWATARG